MFRKTKKGNPMHEPPARLGFGEGIVGTILNISFWENSWFSINQWSDAVLELGFKQVFGSNICLHPYLHAAAVYVWMITTQPTVQVAVCKGVDHFRKTV